MEKGWDPRARKCISLVLSAVSSSFDNDVMGAEGAPSGDAAAAWLLDTLECVVPTAGVPLGEPVLLFFAAVFTLVTRGGLHWHRRLVDNFDFATFLLLHHGGGRVHDALYYLVWDIGGGAFDPDPTSESSGELKRCGGPCVCGGADI